MKKITIVYTRSKKILPVFSWLVRLYQWTDYSHVCIKIDTPQWEPIYYQASEGMAHLMSEEVFNKKHKIIKSHHLLVPPNINNNMIKRMSSVLGKPYAIMQNVGIALVALLNILGISIKNPWAQGVNCSELVYTQLLQPMLGKEANKDPQLVTPKDIYTIINSKCQKNLIKD